jgi:tetratricopeptide (TPR) repeat protein
MAFILRLQLVGLMLFFSTSLLSAQTLVEDWLDVAEGYLKSQPDSAIYYALKAQEVAKQQDDIGQVAHASVTLAKAYKQQGLYDLAIVSGNKAIELYNQVDDVTGYMSTLISLGNIYTDNGEFVTATEYFVKAYAIADSLNDFPGLAAAATDLGIIYGYQENFEKSAFYFDQAVNRYTEMGDTSSKISNLLNLGVTYIQSGEVEKGAELFQLNYDLAVEFGDRQIIANACLNLSSLNYEMGKIDSSRIWIEKAIQQYTENDDNKGLAQANGNLCEICLSLGDTTGAIAACTAAQEIAERIGALYTLKSVYDQLTDLHLAMGEYKQAMDYQSLYRKLNDSLFTLEKIKVTDELERKYRTEKMSLEITNLEQENRVQQLENAQKKSQLANEQSRNRTLLLLIGLVLLLAVVAVLVVSFIQQKRKAKLRERALEIEQRLLRSQMNPHFIFNSMNAIQSYIAANNSFKAEVFLSKFAQLMRSILDNTRLPLIALEDEVATLKLYVELEQDRFKGKFDFTIEADDDLDDLKVPPMIVQPYVENAILHGLQNLEHNGQLTIRFTEQGEQLICEVEDNGIGREKAREIRERKKSKHQSVSMELTQDRLSMLGSEKEAVSSVEIIDLKNDDGAAIGTKVCLKLPINYS